MYCDTFNWIPEQEKDISLKKGLKKPNKQNQKRQIFILRIMKIAKKVEKDIVCFTSQVF